MAGRAGHLALGSFPSLVRASSGLESHSARRRVIWPPNKKGLLFRKPFLPSAQNTTGSDSRPDHLSECDKWCFLLNLGRLQLAALFCWLHCLHVSLSLAFHIGGLNSAGGTATRIRLDRKNDGCGSSLANHDQRCFFLDLGRLQLVALLCWLCRLHVDLPYF
jgi:hypothetical protein